MAAIRATSPTRTAIASKSSTTRQSAKPHKAVRFYGAPWLVVIWLLVVRTEERVVHAPSQVVRNQRVPDVVNLRIRNLIDFAFRGFFTHVDPASSEPHL